jgi:hypothetical protein
LSWVVACVVFFMLLAGSESLWRSWGWRATARDSDALWAAQRALGAQSPRTFYVLGTSRAQLGIDHGAIRERFPGARVANLSTNGKCPHWSLEDLAGDARVDAGDVVLVELAMYCLDAAYVDAQRETVQAARELTIEPLLDAWLGAQVDAALVTRHPQLGIRRVAYAALSSSMRTVDWRVDALPSREMLGHYDAVPDDGYRARNFKARTDASARIHMEPAAVDAALDRLRVAAEKLRAREAQVLFVRMPASEDFLEVDARDFPRARYWDRLGPVTGAPTLHFADHAELQGFLMPDGQHLVASERAEFTRRLIDILLRRASLVSLR